MSCYIFYRKSLKDKKSYKKKARNTKNKEDDLLSTNIYNLSEDDKKNALQALKTLKEIEDKILEMLSNSSGDILEDEELINTLGASKQTSATIEVALKEAEATELIINDTRQKYRPVATRGSILFFCISDLRNVEPMLLPRKNHMEFGAV